MMSSTRFPPQGLVMLGAFVTLTMACSSPESPSATGATSVTELAPAAARLGPTVNKELASLRNATAAFHDIDAAMAAGYVSPVGIPCVSIPAGTMGIHVPRPASLDLTVIPNEPEVLLYLPKANGGYKLIAVEYVVPALVRPNAGGAPRPYFGMTPPSDAGYTVITPRPSVFGESFEGPMEGHEPGMPWHYDKHVWVWETNPNGMFSQWNPSISCN